MRTNFDFSHYRSSTVGFDRLFDHLETSLCGDSPNSSPPFDILQESEDSYRITLAAAGFRPDDIEIVAQQNLLTVTGKFAEDEAPHQYLHRGIYRNGFERRFQLADYIQVGGASFEYGLLSIALKRVVPEAAKPRKIAINGAAPPTDRLEPFKDDARQAA